LTEPGENRFQCVATLAERDVMRYSPGGVPIVAARLLHQSELQEAGIKRVVEFDMPALAAGSIAAKLEQADLGAVFRFKGFIARKNRNSKSLVFHLIDFEPITL
jgi:primosomal replication protein N